MGKKPLTPDLEWTRVIAAIDWSKPISAETLESIYSALFGEFMAHWEALLQKNPEMTDRERVFGLWLMQKVGNMQAIGLRNDYRISELEAQLDDMSAHMEDMRSALKPGKKKVET